MATKRPAPVIEKELDELRNRLANLDKTKATGDKKLTEAKIAELEAELKSLGDPAP